MSDQHHRNDDDTLANFAGFVLTMIFIVIVAVISIGTPPPTIVNSSNAPTRVAGVSAQVADPTATPIPATAIPTQPPTAIPTIEPTIAPTIEPTNLPEPTLMSATDDTNTTSASDASYDPDVVAHGQSLFVSCGACHGQEGQGVLNLGKSLVDSEFVDSQTDDELVNFIKTGRPIWDPLNTTGIDMPPKGGNPTLTDEDILAIVAYIRSLNQ